MSKIICDVCGTAYPETASQCPICGCAKAPNAKSAAGDDADHSTEVTERTYVKGGRFSKGNVKKSASSQRQSERRAPKNRKDGSENNKTLVVVVSLLLVAILLVVIYICVRVFLPDVIHSDPTDPVYEQTTPNATIADDTKPPVPCTDIKLSSKQIELAEENSRWMLGVELAPKDTTDQLVFASADPKVATVDEKGIVLPVGPGETVITVTCGSVSVECTVRCTFGDPTVPPETTEPPIEVPADFKLKLNRSDFTLSKKGETWKLFKDTDAVKASNITWTVEDPAVATVENGVVTGVGYGTTTVHAQLGNQKVSCTVRCSFKDKGEKPDPDKPSPTDGVRISSTDVTLKVGETFFLELKNKDSAKINVEWKASADGFVEIDGSKITGKAPTTEGKRYITVSTTYEGETYSCTVRVIPDKNKK